MPKTIFFSVGEPSGDLHGANLIRALRERSDSSVRFVGYGGPRMAAEGAQLHFDLTQLAVMGFLQVFWKLPKFLRLASRAAKVFKDQRPDAVVLIDFPGFNWHIARLARRHGVPVYYYGTPQVWGWAPWRVKKLRKYVDHALCKLPFEEDWLRKRGVNATYVGHPYFDELTARRLDEPFVNELTADDRPLVALLPGSRTQEVQANFHWQLKAMSKVRAAVPNARFVVAAFKDKHVEIIEKKCQEIGMLPAERPTVHVGRTPELIEAATCCLAVSGSVSLELLHHAKPTVVLYHVSRFAFFLQKIFRRVRYITLVNLLTTSELFPKKIGTYDPKSEADAHVLMPEYLTCVDRSQALANHLVEWLTEEPKRSDRIRKLEQLRDRVGKAGASHRAADYLAKHINLSSDTTIAAA